MAYNFERLIEEIDARLSRSPYVALSQLARDLGVSRHVITRLLRHRRGASYRPYQQSLILQRAVRLLGQSGNLSIKEIAFSIGFSSASAFSRFIRFHTGKTPSEIRRASILDRS